PVWKTSSGSAGCTSYAHCSGACPYIIFGGGFCSSCSLFALAPILVRLNYYVRRKSQDPPCHRQGHNQRHEQKVADGRISRGWLMSNGRVRKSGARLRRINNLHGDFLDRPFLPLDGNEP